ncbi:MAG: TA system VapC family ribonuclease toxin [Terracidiphilus sp.]|jgi:toxin-antitoxin system PIN domain toxin
MTFLLDVNVLLVLHDPRHPHYKPVFRWFAHTSANSFATCPITQSGLFRLLTQGIPGLVPFEMVEARKALEHLTGRTGHIFWPDAPPWIGSTKPLFNRLQGHRQATDAYLLGLAILNKGKLATLDLGILHLAGAQFAANVELIEP